MTEAWFDDFLENAEAYGAAEDFWRNLHREVIASLGVEDDWHPWLSRHAVDGTPLERDGNPMVDLKSDSLDRAYRVNQYPPSDAHPSWIAAWVDDHRDPIYEGTGFPADDLVVTLVLTESTAATARELVAYWLRPETSADTMRALIERLGVAGDQQMESMPTREVSMSTIDEEMVLAHFIVSDDVERSRRFYTEVLGGKTVIGGEAGDEVTYVALANSWIIINVGGGPTDDKPTVTLEPPPDPDRVSSFLNIRVADIHAVYDKWSARGAQFLTPPKQHETEIRCYIRDPDGYLIEVGQTTLPRGWRPPS